MTNYATRTPPKKQIGYAYENYAAIEEIDICHAILSEHWRGIVLIILIHRLSPFRL